MTNFSEEELQLLGRKYLEEHPDFEARYLAARESEPAPPAPEPEPEPVVEDKHVSVMYPVSWPQASDHLPNPHSTLIYLGKVSDADFTKEAVREVLDLFVWEPFDVAISGFEKFGENQDIPVVTLESAALFTNRQTIEAELASRGIKSGSDQEYRPHITVTDRDMVSVPFHTIRLGIPQVWWGDERA